MGRLVSVDSTSSERQRWRRTIAEALHRLMAKRSLDAEAKDLAAIIVFGLREIEAGVERSATVWDKKHYYIKADRLREEYGWTGRYAERMASLILAGDWIRLPLVLAELAPRFQDVHVAKLTRSAAVWEGAYARLMAEKQTNPERRVKAGEPGG
jgi:hypothetical protein